MSEPEHLADPAASQSRSSSRTQDASAFPARSPVCPPTDSSWDGRARTLLDQVAKHEHVPEALAVEVFQMLRLLPDIGVSDDLDTAVSQVSESTSSGLFHAY